MVNVPPVTFVGLELFYFAARFAKSTTDRLSPREILFIRVLDDRHDQTPVERDRNPDIHLLVVNDVCRRRLTQLTTGNGAQRINGRFQDERQVGELRARRVSYSFFFA